MTTLKDNVTFISNDKSLSADEKLEAIQNECQQTLYTDEDYDEAVYGKGISIFDTGMGVEDAEERNNTSLDPLFLEEGIDVELLCQVRMLHQGIKTPSETELDNYDKLDDCLSINHSGRDKRKFVVMNTPGYETKYHMLPGGGMVASLVKSSSPYTRKVIWNEEGNFEEIIDNDKPDWVLEMEMNEEKIAKAKKLEHKTKILWKAIKDSRAKYKKCYALMERYQANGLLSYASKYKKQGDEAYKEYMKYSRVMDKMKELDAKIDNSKLKREADTLLHLFVEMQQKCPDKYVDSLTREDVKAKYAKDGYERTRYFLKRLVNRAEELAYLETA